MKKLVSLFLSAAMVFSAGAAASAVPELPTEPLVASAAEVIYCDLCETEIPEGSEHHTPLGLTICDSCNSAGAGGTTVAFTTTTTTSDAYIPPATDEPIPLIPEYYIDLEVGDYLEFTAELIALDYETNGAACTYENGLLVAVEEGCFSLMFYNEDGSAYAHYNIYVTDPSLPANTAPYIEEGCICTVPVRALAGSTTVTVTCDNEDVAVVDDIEYLDELVNIHILGVSEGTATLTVEDENGYYAEIYVTVYVPEEETTEVVTGTTLAPQDHCDSCGEFVPEGEGVRSPLGMFLCQSCSALGIGGTTTSYHTTHPDGTGTTTTNHAIGTGTTTVVTSTFKINLSETLLIGGTYWIPEELIGLEHNDIAGDICTIENGLITAVGVGTEYIYFYAADGECVGKIEIHVYAVTEVTFYTTTSTTIPTEYPNETGTTTTTVTGGTYYFTYDLTVGETMTMHGFVAEFPYDVIGTSCEVGDGVISAVRTGQTIIYCYSGNTLIAEYIVNVTIDESLYEDKLMGDINGDSTVSVSDLVAAARMIAQTDESADDLPVVTENGKICADFNKDGMVDAADLTQISLYLAGIAID
ncbi:MAG: hypothetical protein E7501_04285 [Ruminococcus sp.]|nr:hypothetical protein [Ruminococcus sp.]